MYGACDIYHFFENIVRNGSLDPLRPQIRTFLDSLIFRTGDPLDPKRGASSPTSASQFSAEPMSGGGHPAPPESRTPQAPMGGKSFRRFLGLSFFQRIFGAFMGFVLFPNG